MGIDFPTFATALDTINVRAHSKKDYSILTIYISLVFQDNVIKAQIASQ